MHVLEGFIKSYENECKLSGTELSKNVTKAALRDKMDFKAGQSTYSNPGRLYLAGNNKTDVRLTDNDVLLVSRALFNNVFVKSLDLRYNNFSNGGANGIAQLLKETAVLEELNIMCNDIMEEGAEFIAESLQRNKTLTSLQMNGNKIGNIGGMAFAQMLQVNSTLESLDLGETDLTTETVIAFATVLRYNTALKALNLSRPLLFSHQEEVTVHMANMLKVNSTLRELHLQKMDMRDFGAARLAENLVNNRSLTHLNLSCNRITRDGAAELSKLLKNDTPLQVLDLGFNRLEDDGALHLAEALATMNNTLHTLVLTSNNIKGKGLCAMTQCLRLNTSIEKLYIWGNILEESACIAFAGLLNSGRLESSNTDVSPYVVDGHTYLAELSHGIRRWYYWGPSYGDQAQTDTRPLKLHKTAVAHSVSP